MSAPVSSNFTVLLPKGSSAKTSPRVSFGAGRIFLVGADAAAIGDGDVGADRLAHRVGDQVADRRFLAAHRGAAAVERRRRGADLDLELGVELVGVVRDQRAISGSGSTVAVSTMRKAGHQSTEILPSFSSLVEGDLGDDGEVALRLRLGQRHLAVEVGEEVLVVAGEDQVGGAGADQAEVDIDRRVDDGDDEVGAFLAKRCGAGDADLDRGAKVMSPGLETIGVSSVVRP